MQYQLSQYQTSRLTVSQILDADSFTNDKANIEAILAVLTPSVVEHLPSYFHHIATAQQAKDWLQQLTQESLVFAVYDKQMQLLIGFVFIYVDEAEQAHIGYLLSETVWRRGYAFELLFGLIQHAKEHTSWQALIAGVARDNQASAHLLVKLGFVFQAKEQDVMFFKLVC
ncbi:TPA: GNAT family N-acetyltransferase [Photobacterium damselae]